MTWILLLHSGAVEKAVCSVDDDDDDDFVFDVLFPFE